MKKAIKKSSPATPSRSLYDTADLARVKYRAKPGVSEALVREIARAKKEPAWMLKKRLAALALFKTTPLPHFGPDLTKLDLDKITYFIRPDTTEAKTWADVPAEIKNTFDRLGIPEAEKKALGGVGAQYDSDMVYHKLKKDLADKGVIFENMDTAVHEHPELVQKYFMTQCIPINDHKFIMLHAAVWSGGTFLYVPKNVTVDLPLQAYFRMNAKSGGQFEHTLIIADEGSQVSYIEGCSAPRYNVNSLHCGGVEIFVHKNARVRYSSIENWSKDTYNLNTKRALVDEDGVMEWVNGNMGCLTERALVATPNGPVSIAALSPTQIVYSYDERVKKIIKSTVIRKIFSGTKNVYRLEAGGREVEASGNHPFLTLERKKRHPDHKKMFFETIWKPLRDLRFGDMVAIAKTIPLSGKPFKLPALICNDLIKSNNQYRAFTMSTKHLYNPIASPSHTNEDFMWLMGLLIGDGHIDKKRNKINLATHYTEDYRDEVCGVLQRLFNYTVTEKKDRYIIINSKTLCQLFTAIGFGGTASSKTVPAWIFTLPPTQIKAFLAGYFDSDGHVATYAIAYTSISKKLLEQVKLLGIYVGYGVSHITQHRVAGTVTILGNKCQASDSWRLLFNGPEIISLPSRCKRKRKKILLLKTRRNYRGASGLNFASQVNEFVGFARVTAIKKIGRIKTYDIEVEKYHNFIANGLIVHNSGVTMLYPSSILRGRGARSDSLGVAFAGPGQNQDTGAKAIHAAPNTSSTIISKSISKDGGINTFRGLIKIMPNAEGTNASMVCDALLIGKKSIANTIPELKIKNEQVNVAHEARVGRIGEEEIFYLQSRGLTEQEATRLVVSGFIEPIVKALPVEYALELNRLIEMEMEGAVG
ncbi:MAG: Fe-S cluster assembly protein SufB [Candidatus Magasanikbacteria bacterium]|nr:Fe-S cluster assembly protein SufB [Candidatus Magasanikbacteria bacterium]